MSKIKHLTLHRFCDNAQHMVVNSLCSLAGAATPLVTAVGFNLLKWTSYFPSNSTIALGGIGSVLLGAGLGFHDATRPDNTHARTRLSYEYDPRRIRVDVPEKRLWARFGLGVALMATTMTGDIGKTNDKLIEHIRDFSHNALSYTQHVRDMTKEQSSHHLAHIQRFPGYTR